MLELFNVRHPYVDLSITCLHKIVYIVLRGYRWITFQEAIQHNVIVFKN